MSAHPCQRCGSETWTWCDYRGCSDCFEPEPDEPPMREIAPGVHISGRARRILHSGDPRGDDFRAAQEWTQEIRSRLMRLRGELEDLGKIEASFPHDRMCNKVAGTLTLTLIALYSLVDGERSFDAAATRSDELWADARANPDAYVIEDGETWDWHPLGVYKRGGADV